MRRNMVRILPEPLTFNFFHQLGGHSGAEYSELNSGYAYIVT